MRRSRLKSLVKPIFHLVKLESFELPILSNHLLIKSIEWMLDSFSVSNWERDAIDRINSSAVIATPVGKLQIDQLRSYLEHRITGKASIQNLKMSVSKVIGLPYRYVFDSSREMRGE